MLAIFYLKLTIGLRRCELVPLQWSDLDVERQILTVSKSAGRFKSEAQISLTKTANSAHKVFLPKEMVKLLVKEHHPGHPKRRGRQDGLQHPGPLFRRIHPGHR